MTTIETSTLVEDATTHSIALYIVIVAVDKSVLLFEFLSSQVRVSGSVSFLVVLANLLESLCACMLLQSLLCYVVGWLIAYLLNIGTQILVVYFVAVLALNVCAKFLHQFLLKLALWLDGIVSSLERSKKILLRNFLHLALNHHDVLLGSTNHQIHISLFQLLECWVDDELAVDTCYTNLRNWTLERYIRTSKSG